ncbi:radical SAM/SPASM domain-containing protein [Streptomyces sp. NPDC052396]|uniref:radical SAM/SPASM domain-containing protein n=1 Tax=Streptomyces sp. NPDC052396 TaxID=3365689 RepID=UPI0037D3202B
MPALPLRLTFAWLEITGLCNLKCVHCYANSSPEGDHGNMDDADWRRVMDELAGTGVRDIQFIGGEPTLHPGLPEYIRHACSQGMRVEVFSNMTHIRDEVWEALQLPGVRLAFSYYSDWDQDHDDVTQSKGSNERTRSNVEKAKRLGISMRGSVIRVLKDQRSQPAETQLLQLGIRDVRTDTLRPFGRGADGKPPQIKRLCGRCGRGKVAIGPNGDVWPCVFARWMSIGNVHEQSVEAIYYGLPNRLVRSELEEAFPHTVVSSTPSCLPDCSPSFETCSPQLACAPDAACGPTGDGGDDDSSNSGSKSQLRMSPRRSVRYANPAISGTDC